MDLFNHFLGGNGRPGGRGGMPGGYGAYQHHSRKP